MVVIPPRTAARLALAMALGVLLAPLGAEAQQAEPTPEPRLSDGWLSTLQQIKGRVAWSHAFALKQGTAEETGFQRKRLMAELEALINEARLTGQSGLANGLIAWHSELRTNPALPARTPGRHDLPWLGANLRRDPPLSDIRLWGHCTPPSWVEIWHLSGVSKVTWHHDMTLSQVLAALPEAAVQNADEAVLVTPYGTQHARGIAAWNHQATPLTPGSRVMLQLPSANGLSAAGQIVNQRLPAYLATRLPGNECEVIEGNTPGARQATE